MFRRLAENIPSILFLSLIAYGAGIVSAGWAGCITAIGVFVAIRAGWIEWSPILLGINLHFVVTAPLLHLIALMVGQGVAAALLPLAEPAVMLSVAVTGVVLHRLHRGRFLIGSGARGAVVPVRESVILLAVAFAGTGWAIYTAADGGHSIAIPLAVLFVLRRVIVLRRSKEAWGGGAFALALSALSDASPITASRS